MAEGEAPDILKWLRDWSWRRWGWRGRSLFAAIGVALFVWTNTDKIASWPGMPWLIEHVSRPDVPRADPKRFTILVANLDNDVKDEQRKLLLHGLLEFKGVAVLPLDRTIAAPLSDEAERAGHERAREFLKESGASVVLWGTVLRGNGETVPRLWWTPAEDGPRDGRYDVTDSALRLPELFWTDLSSVLDLLISRHDAERKADEGRFVADRLVMTVARVRTLLNAAMDSPAWTPEQIARTRLVLAASLTTLGDQTGRNEPLEEAVAVCRAALEEYTRERAPLDWARTQNNLGIALARLGEREGGTERLKEAVAAFRAALEEYTRERVPLDWAATQNNLGAALRMLGDREGGAARLEEVVAAYRAALEEQTRERVPLDWAMTQSNLGNALARLGAQEGGTERLEEAVAAFRAALEEFTRERAALAWAMTQNNLGNALARLGEREGGTARLDEAVAAFRAALKEYTRERTPLDWAMTQNNLGVALESLGKREGGPARLEEAVAAYRAALEEWTRERAPYYWEQTTGNLERAEAALAKRRAGG